MSKFSVKRPFTVLVAVIAILVLGAVSFLNMTPDLLPNIDLPYIMVMTPYPGATPEKVEREVTKPLEQAFATLENIESVNSTSSSNYSQITLEFTAEANLDTATIDILQQVNQIQPGWGDLVGTPYMLKLNPSMLPVMVASVDREGMDTAALSTFLQDELLNKLEGITGVAAIATEGVVERRIEVRLSQQKINAVNGRVQQKVDEGFDEAQEGIDNAIEQINAQIADLSKKQAELKKQLEAAGTGSSGADTAKLEALMELYSQMQAIAVQLEEYGAAAAGLQEMQAQVAQLEQAEATLQDGIAALQNVRANYEGVLAAKQAYDAQLAEIEGRETGDTYTEEQKAEDIKALKESEGYVQAQSAHASIVAVLDGFGVPHEGDVASVHAGIDAKLAQLQEQLGQVRQGLAEIDAALAQTGNTRADIPAAIAELTEGAIVELQAAYNELERLAAQLDLGEIDIREALDGLGKVQDSFGQMGGMMYQVSAGTSTLITAQATLRLQLQQIQEKQAQLDAQREQAKKGANVGAILTMENLVNILRAQNFDMPAGFVQQDGTRTLVSVGDAVTTPDALENLILIDMQVEGVAPIYLRDVADVVTTDNLDSLYARVNGQDGVLLSFTKQSTYATAEVSDNIQQQFERLAAEYEGLRFVPMMDQGDYIHIVVNSIIDNLLWGALFAIIILLLFLKDLRPTFITLCSIPISVLFAIVLMYFSGVTINMISLSGLAVAVGMLVDNSVVVIDNIYRLRSEGASAARAAVVGASQVAGAIAASTLTTICVFLPIVFIQGLTRQLFTDMALTLGYALLASLIVALTLVPAMSAGLLRTSREKPNKLLNRAIGAYKKALRWNLRHKAIVLIASVVLLAVGLVATVSRGFVFMPQTNMPQLTVGITAPTGASLAEARIMADEVMNGILAMEDVGTVGGMLDGTSGMLGGDGASANRRVGFTMYVMLEEGASKTSKQLSDEINEAFSSQPYRVSASSSSDMTSLMSAMGGSGVSVNLYGNDLDTMMETARGIAEVMEGVPGTTGVNNGIGATDPELHFVVDKEKAAENGLTVAQVYAEIAAAMASETNADTMLYEGDTYDVVVVGRMGNSITPSYIRNLSFTVTTRAGEDKTVYLRDVAEIVETETAQSIRRENQRQLLTISAGIAEGHNVSLVTADVQRALQNFELPAGTTIEYTGENETIYEAFRDLMLMLLLGVLLVYLVMVAQFQSLKSPFIVMFTIPLAFTGGLFALLFAGMEISVVALIGFVMLVGIIVNNGIVLVDYINQLRTEGMGRHEAIVKAGADRMRPILMTSVTTILGLLTMALGIGNGAELMQPVAIVCIGGLTYATLLTLFVVPAIYDLVNRKELRVVTEADLRDAGSASEAEDVAAPPAQKPVAPVPPTAPEPPAKRTLYTRGDGTEGDPPRQP